MNQKSTFNKNLDKAIIELTNCELDDVDLYRFSLKPINEKIGKESSKDTWMKVAKLKNNEIDEFKNYEEVIWLLSAGSSNYPLWINIRKLNPNIIELEFSTRFRHLKTSHNQETGYPLFKVKLS